MATDTTDTAETTGTAETSGEPAPSEITTRTQEQTSSVMYSSSVNIEKSRKYKFDATVASKVVAVMVSVPAPTAYLDALKADVVGRGKKLAGA